jgi:hypothetical protein
MLKKSVRNAIYILVLWTNFLGCAQVRTQADRKTVSNESLTSVEVVELVNYAFTADCFFADRKNLSFSEQPADPTFVQWAEEAISKVNRFLPQDARVPVVKLKLIFEADIKTHRGQVKNVPISIIESYQEPKNMSIRLGMLELKNSKLSFQQTVSHEYSHLVFENLSRKAGKTNVDAEHLEFWPKPVYEGIADLMASFALDTPFTGEPGGWATRNLNEFKTAEEAKNAKDSTVLRARAAFQKMGLIPKYQIYQGWLSTVEKFLEASGGSDPYALGTWFAGSLLKAADSPAKKERLVRLLIDSARSGRPVGDAEVFSLELIQKLQ